MALDINYYKRINSDFERRVGVLNWYEDVEALGFTTDCFTGAFYHRDIPMLKNFCFDNPQFHIVTFFSITHSVNRIDHSGKAFFLANGEKDPSLELNLPQEVRDHFASELKLLLNRLKPDRDF